MSKPKWTEGPWDLEDDNQIVDGIGAVHMFRVVAPNGSVVAEFSNAGCNEISYDDGDGGGRHYDFQAMANASLIAAAPDMASALSACDAAIRNIKKAFGAPGDYGYGTPRGDALFDAYKVAIEARSALSRARGENGQ